MQSRGGVDGRQGGRQIVEWKSVSRPGGVSSPVWFTSLVSSHARWWHVLPLACLLMVGVAVPRFVMTLAVLLLSLVAALGVFVLCVQWPVGYLFHRWRSLRNTDDARRPAARRAPSTGL